MFFKKKKEYKFKKIWCKCGNVFKKEYRFAYKTFRVKKDWYVWRCEKCGQEYLEEIQRPLIIKINNEKGGKNGKNSN